MAWKITTLIIAATFAGLIALMGRYELIGVSDGGEAAYRLDRWTGEVTLFRGHLGLTIQIINPYANNK